MVLPQLEAVRFEGVLPEGRTNPLILACRLGEIGSTASKVVKAIGCPEVTATRQLVAEVIGNVTARRMGVHTPEPCIVNIGPMVARAANLGLRELGLPHTIEAGHAAGCDLVHPAPSPFTSGQNLTPAERIQAVKLYVFDLLSQNPDRRKEKVNCGLTKNGLIAFDFELCFGHLFLPIIGGLRSDPWEPSKEFPFRNHLLYDVNRSHPPAVEEVVDTVRQLSQAWWKEVLGSIPTSWQAEAAKIGSAIMAIAEHADEFGKDILRSLY